MNAQLVLGYAICFMAAFWMGVVYAELGEINREFWRASSWAFVPMFVGTLLIYTV